MTQTTWIKRTGRKARPVRGMIMALVLVGWLIVILVLGLLLSVRVQAVETGPRFTQSPPPSAVTREMRGELQVTGGVLIAPCVLSSQVMLMPQTAEFGGARQAMLTLEGCGDGGGDVWLRSRDVPVRATVRWEDQPVRQAVRLRNGLNQLMAPVALARSSRLELRYD